MSDFLIRADGSPQIGAGHIMRCLTLADALRPHGSVTFFSAQMSPALAGRIEQAGHRWIALSNLHDTLPIVAHAGQARALIVDSYALDSQWRQVVHSLGRPVLTLDDLCDRPLWTDFVVNAAACAVDLPYDRFAPQACRLLGPSYSLVSPAVRAWRDQPAGEGGYVLLTFGGSDPLALTGPVAEQLRHLPLLVILGGSTPDKEWLARKLRNMGASVQIDTPEMGKWIRGARLVISAGGSTLNEVAVLGRPAIAVTVADNQIPATRRADQDGWLVMVDGRDKNAVQHIADTASDLWQDQTRRDQLASLAAGQTDGDGVSRIAAALLGQL